MIERSPERDAAIVAILPHIPEIGWTRAARTGDNDLLFPGGAIDLIEAWSDLADRDMEQDAATIEEPRLSRRVRAILAQRLHRQHPHRDALRRALGLLALPQNARVAASCTARTVDTIWHAAGDTSADFSWYTKRALLTGVYTTTVLTWLRDDSEDSLPTLDFLDRRLQDVAVIGKIIQRVKTRLGANG